MFLSEAIVRAIHADRMREVERATRDHRLLSAGRDGAAEAVAGTPAIVRSARPSPARRGRSGIAA